MSSMSTFGAFTTARLGVYASQKALDVVANNITNINTKGYTRQSLDQVSLYTGSADKFRNGLDARVGNGPLVTGVSQLRDPYLDIRYRNETSTVGYMDAKLGGLEGLSSILDEVAKGEDVDGELGVVEKQFNDLIEQMQRLNTEGAGLDAYDTNVRTSAGSLTKLFNSYSARLTELYSTQEKALESDVQHVNEILYNIRDLSTQIRKSNIYGGDALEMRDARNLLIDELSEYMKIDVTYEVEHLGGGFDVEKLVIKLAGNDEYRPETNGAMLVDGTYATQLSIKDQPVADPNNPGGYLDADGKPVTDVKDAAREYDPNYDIIVGVLMDNHYRAQEPYMLKEPTAKPVGTVAAGSLADAKTAVEADPNYPKQGIVEGRTVEFDYTVKEDPANLNHYEVTRTITGFVSTELRDNAIYGSLQAQRELLTEQGEFTTQARLDLDPNANTKRGIPYYQKTLDVLANQFANIMNEANQYSPVVKASELKEAFAGGDFSAAEVGINDTIVMDDGTQIKMDTVAVDGEAYLFPSVVDCTLMAEADRGYTYDILCGLKDGSLAESKLANRIKIEYGMPEGTTDEAAIAEFKTRAEGLKIASDGLLTDGQKQHMLPAEAGGNNCGTEVPAAEAKPLIVGNVLFSNSGNSDDGSGITAANISISKSWSEGVVRIIQSTDPDAPSTDNSNLNHMLYLLQSGRADYNPRGVDLKGTENFKNWEPASDSVFFTGTFQEMFTDNICGTLAADRASTTTLLDTHSTSANELYVDRDAISGVDLNDEAMNMMQYQKSLNAAYRLMTVIDETLDKLINGTGLVGR